MPNRLGLVHVRPGEGQGEEGEVEAQLKRIEERTENFCKDRELGVAVEAGKLGLKVEEDEVEKFMSASMQVRLSQLFYQDHLDNYGSGAGEGQVDVHTKPEKVQGSRVCEKTHLEQVRREG